MIINKNSSTLLFPLIVLLAIATEGCGVFEAASSASAITREDCEADSAFAFIPEGEFIQGSDQKERDYGYKISAETVPNLDRAEEKLRAQAWFDRESDRQTTSLDAFCLHRNLVTNQEYQEFIRATNHPLPDISEADYQQQGFLVHSYSKVKQFLWTNNSYPAETANHPVVLISYEDALAYADWKEETTGATYRLPTAEEWEKASRGEAGQYFPWGNEWSDEATNAAASGLDYTSEIGQFPLSKSVYGVEDMTGNVFQYTSTLAEGETLVIMKGCGWDDLSGFCRSAYRHTRPVDSRHILFGFRLVKETAP